MQKAEEIHQFRQYRARILSIRDIDQEERVKLQDKVLEMYSDMRVSLKVHTWITADTFLCTVQKMSESHSTWVERHLENI